MIPHLQDPVMTAAESEPVARAWGAEAAQEASKIEMLEGRIAALEARLAVLELQSSPNMVIPYLGTPIGAPIVSPPGVDFDRYTAPALPLFHEIAPLYVDPIYVPHDPLRYPTTGTPTPGLAPTTADPLWGDRLGIGPWRPNLPAFTVTCGSDAQCYNEGGSTASPPA